MACRGSAVRIRYAPPLLTLIGGGGTQNLGNGPTARFFFEMALEGQELAIACAKTAEDILAEDIRLFDLRGLSSLTDFMVVCSGSSMPHLKAVLREIEKAVAEVGGGRPTGSEGKADSRWVVLDYIDVMVHVLHAEMREVYRLEDLWGDAKEVDWGQKPVADQP